MANLTPKKLVLSNINGGKQFAEGDVVTPEAINSPIEASAFVQALATNTPDVSEANRVGTPMVSIITANDGTPKLKFSNLKGETGASGSSSGGGGVGGKKPIYTLQMDGDYITVPINQRLGETGAIVAVNARFTGCQTFVPSLKILHGYFVEQGEDTNQEWQTQFSSYSVIICSDSQYNTASVSLVDGGYAIQITLNAEDYKDCVMDIDIDQTNNKVCVHISALCKIEEF